MRLYSEEIKIPGLAFHSGTPTQTHSPDAVNQSAHTRPLAPGMAGCKKDSRTNAPPPPPGTSTNGKHGLYLTEVFPVNGGGFYIW